MNVYQKLKDFQDEVERETGFRPDIIVSFHASTQNIPNGKSIEIRDFFVEDSGHELEPSLQSLSIDKYQWYCFQARNDSAGIGVNVHDLHRKKEDVHDED